MIGEAVDTLITLGWALAVWIVLMALVTTLALYAALTLAWWVCRCLWRACRGAWQLFSAPRRASRDSSATGGASRPADGHTRPSWVTDEPCTYREAA